MRRLIPSIIAALLAGSIAALAANTTFFTSIGDLVFPFSPPTASNPGTIDNMTIGATTPRAVTATTVTATSVTASGAISGGSSSFTALSAAYVTATTFFNASTANTLTAAGTTRADALALTKAINAVTTAGLNTGVVLPSAANVGEGGTVIIFNSGANPIKVYAAGSDTIDGTAGATGVTLTNAKRCAYTVIGGVFVSAQLGAVSG